MEQKLYGAEVMSTSDLCKRLGLYASIDYLEGCGVSPVARSKIGVYWRTSDFPLICIAISRRLAAQAQEAEE